MPQEFRASLTASIPMGSDAMNAMPEISKALETAKAALEKIGGLTVATNTAVVNSRGPRAKAAPAAAEPAAGGGDGDGDRSEEHTSELQSLMRISYAVFCLKKKTNQTQPQQT